MKKGIKIEDYQLEELQNERLYINRYDMSLMYLYELNRYWKEFLFDLVSEMSSKGYLMNFSFDFLKKEYYNIIRKYNLKIKKEDYIEITDYISLDEWLKINGNDIVLTENEILLIQNIGA